MRYVYVWNLSLTIRDNIVLSNHKKIKGITRIISWELLYKKKLNHNTYIHRNGNVFPLYVTR